MDSILIGKIVNVHGIKGEVKVYPYTDDIEGLSKKKQIYFDIELTRKYSVTHAKIQKNMLILKLSGIDNVDVANTLRDTCLYIPKEEILEEDTYYIEDLENMDVLDVTNNNNCIGKVTYVYTYAANDVLEVLLKNGEKIYLPMIKAVVKKVDIKDNKIYIEPMKGLI